MVPVEMGQQQHIQVRHTQLLQKVSGIDAPGPGVQGHGMVVPDQVVMAAVHQHGKALCALPQLPNQDRVAVAHIDKIQCQHVRPPFLIWF